MAKRAKQTHRVQIGLNDSVYNELKAAAKAEGRTVSGYLRHHALNAASRSGPTVTFDASGCGHCGKPVGETATGGVVTAHGVRKVCSPKCFIALVNNHGITFGQLARLRGQAMPD